MILLLLSLLPALAQQPPDQCRILRAAALDDVLTEEGPEFEAAVCALEAGGVKRHQLIAFADNEDSEGRWKRIHELARDAELRVEVRFETAPYGAHVHYRHAGEAQSKQAAGVTDTSERLYYGEYYFHASRSGVAGPAKHVYIGGATTVVLDNPPPVDTP